MIEKIKGIFTHSGSFHADEIFTIALLKMLRTFCGLFEEIHIIRTRKKIEDFATDFFKDMVPLIIIDIGGEYDPKELKYDHHQKNFDQFYSDGTKYATFGLVAKDFLLELIKLKFKEDDIKSQKIYNIFFENFIKKIDNSDNGESIEPFYASILIAKINPFNIEYNQSKFDKAISIAMDILETELENSYQMILDEELLSSAIRERLKMETGDILILEKGLAWQQEVQKYPEILYVVYPTIDNEWMVQCVPPALDKYFEQKKPLPKEWFGVRDEKLIKITNVKDAIFCHPSGFIAGAKSMMGAVDLATIAMIT